LQISKPQNLSYDIERTRTFGGNSSGMKFLGQAQLFSVASMLLHLHILNSRTNTGNRKKKIPQPL